MTGIRAITLILPDPSGAARAMSDVFGWTVEADFGSFAAVRLPEGIPLWMNAPDDASPVTTNIVIHVSTPDVDASFATAVTRGARGTRQPQDMDYGERSAYVMLEEAPGIIIDLSHPLGDEATAGDLQG